MCFRLFLASPLTLSEVRSMLPDGISADPLPPPLQRFVLDRFPAGRTALLLRRGACACDLAGRGAGDPADRERDLRARYRREGAGRTLVIAALERHRDRPSRPVGPGHWSSALAEFVAEHARNAGPSLYLLDCTAEPDRLPAPWDSVATITAAEVRTRPVAWLPEARPVLVVP